ncbi:MCE family protein [Mycobacterium sp. shizuoka-1]|jgi:phospholipid/cholesterol/gamma-HCH transport system substrate-binding protein|uniref:MCE family protein n=1 Tax=Mycobacteriaceae TaxID=1762 RepID=UPI000C0679CE|nr:MCE family protein [Mycobacterium sp. shizuoka-1]GAY13875.1 putative Mce family protein [Mycobacterium sp. shizuoka-1]
MSRKLVFWVVALIAVGVGIGAVVVPRLAHPPITVTAQFEDTVGLYEGNAVSVLGMSVGTVTSIVPKDRYVEVTLEIDKDVELPADVQAVTVSTSILTDRHVELTPPYRGGPKLQNGDVLGLGRTRTPVEFDRTLAMVDKLASALRGDNRGGGPIADLIGLSDQITVGNGADIKATLAQLSEALRLGSDNGASAKKDIQTIVNSLNTLLQAAADNDTAIREFGSNVRQLSNILAEEDLGTGTTGTKVNQILSQAASLLEKNRDNMKVTASDFQVITQALIDYRRELSEFFDVAPLMIDNVYNAVDPNAGSIRAHGLFDKLVFQGQFGKEICNLLGAKQLGCATGTLRDYGPDFGLIGMLELIAGQR